MIVDGFNRIHNYLRISLTDNCNLRCFYCMPDEEYDFTLASRLMQASEIENLSKLFVSEGVNKIRLTGGEPLVRKDAAQIIESLAQLPVQLTMTTNGTRLHRFIDLLKQVGMRSLNVSLDTLESDKYMLITRRDEFSRVYGNILQLLYQNFHVKVNVVIMRGLNDNEIPAFIEWTRDLPVHVRFIEFMPFSGNKWTSNKVFTMQEMLSTIASNYEYIPLKKEANETAKRYMVPGYAGTFAIISTMTSHFCGDCNRMRLTADGKLKNCLFSKGETDLLSAMRMGVDIVPLIHDTIHGKARELGGQMTTDLAHLHAEDIENRSMITIGG